MPWMAPTCTADADVWCELNRDFFTHFFNSNNASEWQGDGRAGKDLRRWTLLGVILTSKIKSRIHVHILP
jgi:hypothetical protein